MTALSTQDIRALLADMDERDVAAAEAARARQAILTKPAGSLGRLEDLAVWLCAWQGRHPPRLKDISCLVFAGNHGVAAQGVSAFPSEVTAQMVANFEAGGAAINQLCGAMGAKLAVQPLELDRPTEDFTQGPAMSVEDCNAAFQTGYEAVDGDSDLLLVGEMGIANTTSAAALCTILLGGAAEDWVGRGTGVDDDGLRRKATAVEAALVLHGPAFAEARDPMEALRRVGGREIAAMTGAILAARRLRVPVIIDGFVSSAAAAVLYSADKGALDHCVVGHVSAEAGHRRLVEALGMQPLLDLGMRLGEASGAALALAVVRAAAVTHTGMATFGEAGVSEKS
jgi:nicotinate-nucleotide--dimethylbenzimidazole phosphoribosyltransferase